MGLDLTSHVENGIVVSFQFLQSFMMLIPILSPEVHPIQYRPFEVAALDFAGKWALNDKRTFELKEDRCGVVEGCFNIVSFCCFFILSDEIGGFGKCSAGSVLPLELAKEAEAKGELRVVGPRHVKSPQLVAICGSFEPAKKNMATFAYPCLSGERPFTRPA